MQRFLEKGLKMKLILTSGTKNDKNSNYFWTIFENSFGPEGPKLPNWQTYFIRFRLNKDRDWKWHNLKLSYN